MVVTKIITAPTFEIAARAIIKVWRDSATPKIIRMEGFDGVGKSGLARLIKDDIGAEHVEGDSFATKPDKPLPYRKCIRQIEFDEAVERAIRAGRILILDAVCLDELAPCSKLGRGFVVYVKRLSFNNSDPIWHAGLNLEESAPTEEPHRSIHLYHDRIRPHEAADLIVELPEKCHQMTRGPFSRDFCFDPPSSQVLNWSAM